MVPAGARGGTPGASGWTTVRAGDGTSPAPAGPPGAGASVPTPSSPETARPPGLPGPAGTEAWWAVAFGVSAALAAALYHRIAAHRALDQPTRRRIHEAIAAEPGIRIGTLQQRLGLDYKTVARHVRLLEHFGLVASTGPGQRRHFAAGALDPGGQRQALAVARPAARAVLARLRAAGPCDLATLREALDLPASTATVAVGDLAAAGLVTKVRVAGRVVVAAVTGAPQAPTATVRS